MKISCLALYRAKLRLIGIERYWTAMRCWNAAIHDRSIASRSPKITAKVSISDTPATAVPLATDPRR